MAHELQKAQLLSRRDTLIASLGRAEVFIDGYDEQRDQPQVKIRLEYFDSMWTALEQVQGELEDTEATEEGRTQNAELRANFEPRLFKVKGDLMSKLPATTSFETPNPQPSLSTTHLSGIKLPTISLPEFDGDYEQWLPFHDTYIALIHNNPDLPPIQKFHYLRAALKGEAAQLVESISISSANYNLAWNMLTGRYANEYLLKKKHLQALFDIPRVRKETAATLHSLVDDFERHTKILHQLGEPTDSWSAILEHLLCTQLHDDSLRAWEDHASTIENPNYACIIEFLQRRIRVLESISVNHHPSSSNIVAPPQHAKRFTSHQRLLSFSSTAATNWNCPACHQQHTLLKCSKFHRMPVNERLKIVTTKGFCINCLLPNQAGHNCSTHNCRHCGRRHHSLLHIHRSDEGRRNNSEHQPNSSTPVVVQTNSSSPRASPAQQTSAATAAVVPHIESSTPISQPNETVFLMTAIVNVVDAFGKPHPARALLDSASQPNLITERMAQLLRVKRHRVNVTIMGAGQLSKPVRESIFTQVKSRSSNFCCDANFLVMHKVTANLPAQDVSQLGWKLPKEISLADPSFHRSQPIDLVLGARHFHDFFPTAARLQIDNRLPLLVDSVFGWIVSGSGTYVGPDGEEEVDKRLQTTVVSMVSLEQIIERFWTTESLCINDTYSAEEKFCETLYDSTTTRNEEGRYLVRLPRKADFNVMIGNSKASALRRYQLLERRLDRNPELKEEYDRFMREYLSLGHMKLVNTDDDRSPVSYYLPHHPVIKDSSTTTKVRVVFDGSSKASSGFSLNEALCVGPVVQDDLLTLILRFRTLPIARVGDIAKMYRQVLVHPEDTPLQRILWRFTNHTPIQTYELLTVTYGLAPSSFLATRTLKQLAKEEGSSYPLGQAALEKCFYVDDFIGGAQSIEEAVRLRNELSELLSKGGFELRKWTSNRLEVLHGLNDDQIGTQSSLQFGPNETVKTLGISWEPEADFLRFDSQVEPNEKPWTKRAILSTIAKLFDPMGLISPVVVTAKMVMQQLWLLPCGWDDPVPESLQEKWRNYCQDLPKISAFRVQRYAFLPNSKVQLHTFTDASEAAYGACVYARSADSNGNVRVQLLVSKSRVAPLKKTNIARLELCAAALGAHLYVHAKQALDLEIETSHFWTDSTVTLHWLKAPPHNWKTYVANRVAEVHHHTQGSQWRHVPGTDNPADFVSRGMTVDELLRSECWNNGPNWLALPPSNWPVFDLPGAPEAALEARQVVATIQIKNDINPLFLRYDSYTRLQCVTGYCLRYLSNIRAAIKARKNSPSSPSPHLSRSITIDELRIAKIRLTRLAQEDAFSDEIRELEKGKNVSRKSSIRLLNPILDSERILRVGGRLNLSQLPYHTKHPALLPMNHPFTRIVAQYYHLKLLHGGGRHLLATIRQEFWPLNGRRLVRSIVRNCFRCTRLNPEPVQQQIGQLPAQRVIPGRPFEVTGVDYAGPLYLKPAHFLAPALKAYICLFVCFTTKGVHIELASDLSTHTFLNALRRFIARRGKPAHLHSDNGKNFEGAKNELIELYRMLNNTKNRDQIENVCASEGIQWHLTPPKAPHFGGLWEAAVKVAKKHLFRQLGPTKLSFEDMATVLAEIESIMTSRPLLPITDDPEDLDILTPSHFLIGTTATALPDPDVSTVPVNRLTHYQQLQQHVQQFWVRWRDEYLTELQRDSRHRSRNDEITPGRMVIVVDELQAPLRWPHARITAVRPGKDNIVRVVSLRTTKGIITRPVTKVCLLPFSDATTDAEGCPATSNQPAEEIAANLV
ncbi:uncharacterized protein LOC129742461 [Uranotaenia lowii]|uniref:uncharacterized protein LOC129742461 n=1 Tax=Uranotaenia lowii TaxID=190385 RepID=UPI00247876FD|nr:uncharacterized protein LOC129742461 [Uranotaenia lowii]